MPLGDRNQTSSAVDWQERAAWILVVIAIVFWLWFGIGSAIVEGGGWFNWLMHILFPGGIFIISALIALRWRRAGGVMLTILGVFAVALSMLGFVQNGNAPSMAIMMLLTLALPPLLAGLLFLAAARREREVSQKDMTER